MYRVLWLGMLLLGLLLLVIAIILFFVWRVLDLMDEISGRKAKRQIRRLHELNIGTGSLGRMSTTDVYSTLMNGVGVVSDSSSINAVSNETPKKIGTADSSYDEDEVATCDMSSEKTGYISDMGEEGATNFLEDVNSILGSKKSISIIEEQSSLD